MNKFFKCYELITQVLFQNQSQMEKKSGVKNRPNTHCYNMKEPKRDIHMRFDLINWQHVYKTFQIPTMRINVGETINSRAL